MTYEIMREQDTALIAGLYRDYYNENEGGCWTDAKAYKRIHQAVTAEDSLCLIQRDGEGDVTGFAIGWFREYDDLTGYCLDEIIVPAVYQNRGYGTALMKELERRILERGARYLELVSVNDARHDHFYGKLGLYEAGNMKMMAKIYGG